MRTAATIIFARADLSIPGAAEPADAEPDDPGAAEARFFDLISGSSPDVIVLDFSHGLTAKADTICAIRQKTGIPILVVCDPNCPKVGQYRIAGAADCIAAPLDLIGLNHAIQRIMRVKEHERLLPGASAGRQL